MVLQVVSLRVSEVRCGGSGGSRSGSGGELLTRRLLLRLSMLRLMTGCGALYLVDVVSGGDVEKKGRGMILLLVV